VSGDVPSTTTSATTTTYPSHGASGAAVSPGNHSHCLPSRL
jgi:hypothetical protein